MLLKYMQMDELACFAPGMLALGSAGFFPGDNEKYLSLAEEATPQTCFALEMLALYYC